LPRIAQDGLEIDPGSRLHRMTPGISRKAQDSPRIAQGLTRDDPRMAARFCVVGSYRGLGTGVARGDPPGITWGRPFTPGKPPGFHPLDPISGGVQGGLPRGGPGGGILLEIPWGRPGGSPGGSPGGRDPLADLLEAICGGRPPPLKNPSPMTFSNSTNAM
jgi:hypothetical protein